MVIYMCKIRYPPKIRGSKNDLAPSFSVKSKSFRANLSVTGEEEEYISFFFFLRHHNTCPGLPDVCCAFLILHHSWHMDLFSARFAVENLAKWLQVHVVSQEAFNQETGQDEDPHE